MSGQLATLPTNSRCALLQRDGSRIQSRRVGGRRRAAGDRRGLRLRAAQQEKWKSEQNAADTAANSAKLDYIHKAVAGLAAVGLVRVPCYLKPIAIHSTNSVGGLEYQLLRPRQN